MMPSGFGVGIPHQRAQDDPSWYDTALNQLQPLWWYNWKFDQTDRGPSGRGYVPMLWKCNLAHVRDLSPIAAVMEQPLWLLGNEPDLERQSNTQPIEFAAAVERWKGQVSGAFALPGVLACGFGYGYDWMDEYLRWDGPIPDVWHFHIYADDYDDWMKELEQARIYFGRIADRPMIVSECAAWMPYGNLSVMNAVQEATERRYVQAAAWFSAYYDRWTEPSLLTVDGALTELGTKYTKERHEVFLPHVAVAEGV